MARRKRDDGSVLYVADTYDLMPDDATRKCRSTPLPYVKFRTPGDGTSEGELYHQRREAVKAMPDGWAMLLVFDELVLYYVGNKPAPLRGWLVDHRLQAASDETIARTIGCKNLGMFRRAKRALLEVGLLIRHERPDFETYIRQDRTIPVNPRPPWTPPAVKPGAPENPAPGTPSPPDAPPVAPGGTPSVPPRDATTPTTPSTPTTADATIPERVEHPTQAEGEGERQAHTGEPPGVAGNGAGCRNGPAVGRKVPESVGKIPESSGPRGEDVNRDPDGRRETETATKTPTTAPAAPPPSSADRNGRRVRENKPATATPTTSTETPDGPTPNADGATGELGNTHRPDTSTHAAHEAAAEPAEPTEADPGGTGHGWGDCHIEALTNSIMGILYQSRDELVEQGRRKQPPQGPDEFRVREKACIASAWEQVCMMELDQAEMVRLVLRAEKAAGESRKKPRLRKPRGADWRYWLTQHMRGEYGPRWAKVSRHSVPSGA